VDLFYIELNNPKTVAATYNMPDVMDVQNQITGREYN
jgi:hypothetical protein